MDGIAFFLGIFFGLEFGEEGAGIVFEVDIGELVEELLALGGVGAG